MKPIVQPPPLRVVKRIGIAPFKLSLARSSSPDSPDASHALLVEQRRVPLLGAGGTVAHCTVIFMPWVPKWVTEGDLAHHSERGERSSSSSRLSDQERFMHAIANRIVLDASALLQAEPSADTGPDHGSDNGSASGSRHDADLMRVLDAMRSESGRRHFLQAMAPRSYSQQIPETDSFQLLIDILRVALRQANNQKDFHTCLHLIELSQVYYHIDASTTCGAHLFAYSALRAHETFANLAFWEATFMSCVPGEHRRALGNSVRSSALRSSVAIWHQMDDTEKSALQRHQERHTAELVQMCLARMLAAMGTLSLHHGAWWSSALSSSLPPASLALSSSVSEEIERGIALAVEFTHRLCRANAFDAAAQSQLEAFIRDMMAHASMTGSSAAVHASSALSPGLAASATTLASSGVTSSLHTGSTTAAEVAKPSQRSSITSPSAAHHATADAAQCEVEEFSQTAEPRHSIKAAHSILSKASMINQSKDRRQSVMGGGADANSDAECPPSPSVLQDSENEETSSTMHQAKREEDIDDDDRAKQAAADTASFAVLQHQQSHEQKLSTGPTSVSSPKSSSSAAHWSEPVPTATLVASCGDWHMYRLPENSIAYFHNQRDNRVVYQPPQAWLDAEKIQQHHQHHQQQHRSSETGGRAASPVSHAAVANPAHAHAASTAASSTPSAASAAAIQIVHEPAYLAGERLVTRLERCQVLHACPAHFSHPSSSSVHGTLFLTNYRVHFAPYDAALSSAVGTSSSSSSSYQSRHHLFFEVSVHALIKLAVTSTIASASDMPLTLSHALGSDDHLPSTNSRSRNSSSSSSSGDEHAADEEMALLVTTKENRALRFGFRGCDQSRFGALQRFAAHLQTIAFGSSADGGGADILERQQALFAFSHRALVAPAADGYYVYDARTEFARQGALGGGSGGSSGGGSSPRSVTGAVAESEAPPFFISGAMVK
jgi:hypothetical protein